ncbi:LuxR C-terminal-related transcriptional regulator [Paraburkholderia caffeinilytica]|uniref:LuxR C-terminal-related transcriptional regulator n=1 Tax=Paraburkholderia caffeinilytica TaxID=1761016 RepID=UPI0038BD4829
MTLTIQTPQPDESNLPAKFAPPRIGPRHIVRKRLIERLRNEAQHCALTLITGSAGFGKTILLVQWRQELMKHGAEVAWLALAADDRRKAVFCRDLLGALARLGVAPNDMPAAEDDDRMWPVEPVAATLIALAERVAKDIYLFIDDYHHVDDPWVHELMRKLVTHSPANLHIVIASRTTPPLSLSRLRVYGQLAEAGFEDLPFSLDETQAFFEQNLATIKLTADELQLIQDVTHGWPASLQLIAIMLRNRPAARGQLPVLLRRSGDLQNYLAEDVIAQVPADMIAFLEMLAPLRRFNAALAAHVTGQTQAADLMKRAEEEFLLIQRVETDDRTPWYRFHPLLGEFLGNRLAARGGDLVQALHRSASAWFASQQMLVDAVRHAKFTGDLALAVRTVESAMPPDWRFSAVGAMAQLLDHLPEEMLAEHPRLSFLGCLTYALTARPAQAQRWLDQLRRSHAARLPGMEIQLALAEATIATQRDDGQHVVGLLERPQESWPSNRTLKYVYIGALVTAFAHVGRIREALRLHEEHTVQSDDQGSEIALMFEATLPATHLKQGQVRETARLGAALLQQAETTYGRHSVCADLCAAMLGDAYYELDRIADARDVLANRTNLLRASWPDVMVQASLVHARLDRIDQGSAAALAFLQRQAAHFRALGLPRPAAFMLGEAVHILLDEGDHVRAQGVMAQLDALATADVGAAEPALADETQAIAAIARARLALVNCNTSEALNALQQARAFALAAGRERLLVRVNLLAAAAYEDIEQAPAARQCLVDALNTGATLGLVRTFIDDGGPVAPRFATLRNAAALSPQAAILLDALLKPGDAAHPPPPIRTSKPDTQALAREGINLTPREREILLLISQAMSNKRIALTLNISVGTTKWNVRNILTKLGVSSRYDAMTWAREHGYIE